MANALFVRMTADAEQEGRAEERARRLVAEVCLELVSSRASARRPRTMTVRTATAECAAMARASLKAGGVTQPSAEPDRAGHGIAMLPDIVAEALAILTDDRVLKATEPEVADLLRSAIERLKVVGFRESDVAVLEAYCKVLERTFIEDAFAAIEKTIASAPKALFDLETICGQLISELRARGWADESIEAAAHAAGIDTAATASALGQLRTQMTVPPTRFQCFVPVTVTTHRTDLAIEGAIDIVDSVPGKPEGMAFPMRGPYMRVEVEVVDYRYAAEAAYSRVSSILGAAAVFVSTDLLVRSHVVAVKSERAFLAVDVRPRVARAHRSATTDQLARVARSAFNASQIANADGVFDAIRHRQRAIEAADLESRFMLLWLGIERLVLGTRDFGTILAATKGLVPKAIALGRLRREATALGHAIVTAEPRESSASASPAGTPPDVDEGRVSHRISVERLVELLLSGGSAPQSRRFTALFFDDNARLTQWYAKLQKELGGGSGAKIADYFDASRERIEWQVMRLYRARNSVAHAARGPAWLADLVNHAYFYLTQLIAISVHYRESEPTRPAYDILLKRVGHYDAFLGLLRAENERARQAASLLRPTSLVGEHRAGTSQEMG